MVPPTINSDTIKITNDSGMQLMTWSFGYDWEADYISNPKALTQASINSEFLSSGSNILMHDRSWTRDALKDMIVGYRAANYEIVDPKLIEARPTKIVD